MAQIKISASFVCSDFTKLGEEVKTLKAAGTDYFHHDIMDGVFVPMITYGPDIIKTVRKITDIYFDTHLMIVEPERYVENFVNAGSNSITVHVEACKNFNKVYELKKKMKFNLMLSINPKTPVDSLMPYLDRIDGVLVMSVTPGYSGQKFMPEVIPKLEQLRELSAKKNKKLELAIDGGINTENAPLVVKAGASILICGSSIFWKNISYKKAIEDLRKSVEGI